jgi:hypothetical protein
VFIYGVNEHKKGQFEPAGLGKLIEKQFSIMLKGKDWKDFQSCLKYKYF